MPPRQKRSPDPLQEQLRQHKKEWNAATREFISHLIAFKDGINGRGNAEAGLPPSNIKDPLPGEIGSFLGAITSEFQALTSGAGSIVGEQSSYSKNRRKGKSKGQKGAPPSQNQPPSMEAAPSEQADQILSRLSFESSRDLILNKYGSTRGSRAWQYLKSFFSSKEFNKQRIGLLSASADLFFSCLDFENDVLTLDIDNTPGLISKFKYLKYNLEALSRSFIQIKQDANSGEQNDKTPPPSSNKNDGISELSERSRLNTPNISVKAPIEKQVLDIKDALVAFREAPNGFKYATQINGILDMIAEFLNEPDETFRAETRNNIIREFKKLQALTNKSAPKEADSYIEIIKIAHNPISRFLKRKLVNALKFNKTAVHRLRIVDNIDRIKKTLQKMMDGLEKSNSNSILTLEDDIKQINADLENIKGPLSILNIMYRERFYEDEKTRLRARDKSQGHHNQHDPMMDWVLRRKVRRELSDDLDML